MKILKIFILAFVLISCKKEKEDIIGKSTIRGSVYEQLYNDGTCQAIGNPYPLIDHRVYIVSSNANTHPLEDVLYTKSDGIFEFRNILKGVYSIRVVGECNSNCEDGCQGELRTIEVSVSVGEEEISQVGILTVKEY